jgi:hypothetical protein
MDPGFARADAWSAEGAGVEFLDEPGLDPGIVLLDETALCDGQVVSQIVEMPGSEVGDTFAVEMSYRTSSITTPVAIDVYVGRALRTLPTANGLRWNQVRFCLGEAAYGAMGKTKGGPVEFRIGGSGRDNACKVTGSGRIEIDRFQVMIAQPGECPTPGSVLNGAAEPDLEGWVPDTDDVTPSKGIATAALESGVGRNGTGGARLYQDGGGNLVGIGTQFSVPLPTEDRYSPALEFWWRADGLAVFAEVGPQPVTNFPWTYLEILEGEGGGPRYCLPPWTYGSVVELWFLPLSGTLAGEFVVDDVKVVNDERCGRSTTMLDPHFDSSPNRWPGALWGQTGSAVDEPVQVVAGRGRSGAPEDGAVVLSYATSRALIVFNQWVLVPEPNGLEGPQLTIFSNISETPPGEPEVQVAGIVGRNSTLRPEDFLPAGVGWVQTPYCLPRAWAGRWLRFRVEVRTRGELPPFEVFDQPREVLLDDFELTTSGACTE